MNYKHIENVEVQAIFSQCKKYRYGLIIKSKDKHKTKTLCAIMQNPSMANENFADKSVQFIEKLVFEGYYDEFKEVGKLIICNQFAYIQTNNFEDSKEKIGIDNDKYLEEFISQSDIILIAWGKSNNYKKRIDKINSMLKKYDDKILLKTEKHPSRGTYVDFISKYDL